MKEKYKHISLIVGIAFCILILFFNDRYWKYEYSNWATGKLSDFAGLLAFPLFIGLVFPKTKKYIAGSTAVLFFIWKTPLVDPLIAGWNNLGLVELIRTVDYTDYMSLTMPIIAHVVLIKVDVHALRLFLKNNVAVVIRRMGLFFAFIVFCSTSMYEPTYPIGDVLIDKYFRIKGKSKQRILQILNEEGHVVKQDSVEQNRYGTLTNKKHYQLEYLILDDGGRLDTLYDLNFRLFELSKGSSFQLLNFSLKNKHDLQDWKALKRSSKMYKELIKQELVEVIRQHPINP